MSADALLTQLQGVKRTGPGRWLARCSAHDDHKASLAIRELDDGRVLLHCFAGCCVEEVLAATGLTFDALYPARETGHQSKPERRPFSALDALRCIAFEATLIVVTASNIARGMSMTKEERLRLHTAAGRINHALEIALS